MSLLLESIKVIDRDIPLLEYHIARMTKSLKDLFDCELQLDKAQIEKEISGCTKGIYKLRIIYDHQSYQFDIHPYTLKNIRSLKVVRDDALLYNYKYHNRSALERLYNSRESADDILIAKNELVTDSYYCNIAFLKNGVWYTPMDPLLEGTRRQSLIESNQVQSKSLRLEDLHSYEQCRLFNAMIEFGELEISVSDILFH